MQNSGASNRSSPLVEKTRDKGNYVTTYFEKVYLGIIPTRGREKGKKEQKGESKKKKFEASQVR